MKEADKESISALFDNDLDIDSQGLIKDLSKDAEMKAVWSRYQTISDVMQGEAKQGLVDLSASISESLADEPVVLAPSKSRFEAKRFFKPLTGMAIAASVAAVAIVSVQQLQNSVPGAAIDSTSSIAATDTKLQGAEVFAVNNAENKIQTESLSESQKAALQSRLDHYLLNHYQRNNTKGVQGVMPYARIVTHEIDAKNK